MITFRDLTGTTVKYVLEQDKAAFIRLIGVSVLQSAASSFVAPSLRYSYFITNFNNIKIVLSE